MSSTEAPGESYGSFAEDPDQAFFRSLEEAFLQLRGTATLLGPEDWSVARAWHQLGIPLDLVIAVMEAGFARQRERRSKRGISSLKYFRAAVAAAWDERLALLAGGAAEPVAAEPRMGARLLALAAAIPDRIATAPALRERIGALQGDPLTVEEALAGLDLELLDAADALLSVEERASLDQRVARATRRSQSAAPAEELVRIESRLRAQALRAHFGLPLLSLFASEALSAQEP